jgi:hypothetical protein
MSYLKITAVDHDTYWHSNMPMGLAHPQLLFITDEAHFHLSGYVNAQNTRIWSEQKSPRSSPDSAT